ncbi:MAG: hypothetical protein JNK95_04965 [Candidatus Competibacter sp.]|nr:hypothetical protein [Candidatus Competibacter sp.]MDG4606466.1 hypothetical protein [Candidatus Contendobacter sp.]MDS4059282.1 hypothetical protein [Candidatus Contendobacter sp.]
METTQKPPSEFDYAAAAADIVRYVRQQWPDAGTWRQAEALIVAVYAVGGFAQRRSRVGRLATDAAQQVIINNEWCLSLI